MNKPFQEMAGLDRVIHEPARLSIMTALEVCRDAEFLYLQRLTGLSKGNLSSHLSKLEDAGLVRAKKGYTGKIPQTRLSLTQAGRTAIERHWRQLSQLRELTSDWRPE